MNETEKKIISEWRYEEEYSIYNMPSYNEQLKKGIGFANEKRSNNFYAYYDGPNLIGFTNILEEETEVFIGIGVHPKLCNQGYGQKILQLTSTITKQLYSEKQLYLEVRAWNQRAINCYKKAGFQIDGLPFEQSTSLGQGIFYRMIKRR